MRSTRIRGPFFLISAAPPHLALISASPPLPNCALWKTSECLHFSCTPEGVWGRCTHHRVLSCCCFCNSRSTWHRPGHGNRSFWRRWESSSSGITRRHLAIFFCELCAAWVSPVEPSRHVEDDLSCDTFCMVSVSFERLDVWIHWYGPAYLSITCGGGRQGRLWGQTHTGAVRALPAKQRS